MFDTYMLAPLRAKVHGLGNFGVLVVNTGRWMCRRPWRGGLILTQIEKMGIDSLPIVMLVAVFTGMVFALQTAFSFSAFNAETLVGATVAISLTREIGPVFTSLMLIARTGSAIAAEIGSMAVTEQIDALDVMAVSPIQYLVVPRLVAACVIYPLLTGLFNVVGVMGAYFVGVHLLGIPEGPFMQRLYDTVELEDFWGGLFKALVFGFFVALICCYHGLRTEGGATGVGRSTTKAVVYASVCILVSDYFLTSWILEFIQK